MISTDLHVYLNANNAHTLNCLTVFNFRTYLVNRHGFYAYFYYIIN